MPPIEDIAGLSVAVKFLTDKYVRPYTDGPLVLAWSLVIALIVATGRQIMLSSGRPADLWQFGAAIVIDAAVGLTGAVVVTDGHSKAREMATIRREAAGVATNPVSQPPSIVGRAVPVDDDPAAMLAPGVTLEQVRS